MSKLKTGLNKIKQWLAPHKASSQQVTPYQLMGEKAGIDKLVNDFYDIMDSAPEAKNCRDLHGDDLLSSREKLKLFLTQWLGGPLDYSDLYGHPRMRMRHMKFKIGQIEVDEWLWCMNHALNQQNLNEELRVRLDQAFHQFAHHMKNSEGE